MTTLKIILRPMATFAVMTFIAFPAFAQDNAPTQVLVTNVRVFDGTSDKLTGKTNVLVENNLIKEISANAKAGTDATVIDGGGRVLMPGLIEAHGHLSAVQNPITMPVNYTWDYIGALMGEEAERYLMRGFTTLRDAGGPVFGLKQAIDQGYVEGPRVFPSGALVSQTSGHGDFRTGGTKSSYFFGGRDKPAEVGYTILADGVPEVQKAVRENFRMQASQIKVMAGGGVASASDPLETVQYTFEEMKAAVDEATRWGTYVMVHAHVDSAVIQALDAGVKSIDHGPAIAEETIKRMAKEGVWWSPQAYFFMQDVETNPSLPLPVNKEKARQLQAYLEDTFKWAKQYGVKIVWGTDAFASRQAYDESLLEFEYRAQFFSNIEQLQQITGNNAELLAMSGGRSPYKDGPLGVIKPGAYADLLILEGNPLDDIKVMMDPENNLKLIMKDGKVYKNTLK